MSDRYATRRAKRDAQRERALGGETLAAYKARAEAKPPTLAEIFAKNRTDTAVCPVTGDLFTQAGKLPRSVVKALRRRCGVPK